MNGKRTSKQDEQIRCISKCMSKEQGIDEISEESAVNGSL